MIEATLADRRLHPATVLLRFLQNLPSTLLGLPALVTFLADVGWRYFALLVAASVVLFALGHWVMWRRFTYGIGAGEIVIESGLLHRSRRTIPFDRIQDVDFERGPLQRVFGLAKVRIETGGAAKDEGMLDSLSMPEAERLRAAVRARQGQPVSPGDMPQQDMPVFAMDPDRVMLSGLFNFSLLWMAGIFAVLQQLDGVFGFDIYDLPRWIGLARENVAARLSIGAVLGVALLAVALGIASGVVATMLRDYGFRLTAAPQGLRRERGLLTRSEVVIPKRRIQLALIQSGPLRRALGWTALRVQTLGIGEAKGDGGLQDAAPFARTDEIDAILAETRGLRRPDPAALRRVSSAHLWKIVALAAAGPIVPLVIATLLFPPLLLAGLAIPLLIAAAIVERRWHRYAFDGDLVFVQSGWWRRRLWILPVRGIQTVTLRRSWLQRRLDIASLRFDTAGASMFGGPGISDMRHAHAEALAAAILAQNHGPSF